MTLARSPKSAAPGAKPPVKTYSFKSGFKHELEVIPLNQSFLRSKEIITRPHRADFYQIVWVQKGSPTLLLDFKAIRMEPNSALFIRKNRILMYDQSGKYDGKALLFTDDFFIREKSDARYLSDCPLFSLFNEHPVVSIPKDDANFHQTLNLLESELAAPAEAHQHAALRNLMQHFLILSERLCKSPQDGSAAHQASRSCCRRFMEMIEKDFRAEKKISKYATRLGISEKRLQAATAETVGKPPKALIDERIILEAKRLLLFGETSIKEIAYELGFDELTNFVKYFRKHAGTTPADFRVRSSS